MADPPRAAEITGSARPGDCGTRPLLPTVDLDSVSVCIRPVKGELRAIAEDEGLSSVGDFLRLCRSRALAYVDRGDPCNAMQSLFSDLMKHPGTQEQDVLHAFRGLLLECSENQAREAIDLIPRVIEDDGLTSETLESVTRLSLEAHEIEMARYRGNV